MESLIQLREVATQVGATIDQVKYWCRLLGIRPVVKGRVAHVQVEDVARLAEMGAAVAAGKTPREAAGIGSHRAVTVSPLPPALPVANLEHAVLAVAEGQRQQFENLRQLIVGLVEANQNQAQQLEAQGRQIEVLVADVAASKNTVEASRASADAAQQEAAQLRQLVGGLAAAGVNQAREFAAIRAAISKPTHVVNLAKFTEKPEPVKTWTPPKPKADPLAEAPWWKKLYIKAFEPAQLRRRVG